MVWESLLRVQSLANSCKTSVILGRCRVLDVGFQVCEALKELTRVDGTSWHDYSDWARLLTEMTRIT